MLIFLTHLNLIIKRKSSHECKDLISSTFIENLIDEWRGIIIFGTRFVKITKTSADANSPLLLVNMNLVIRPFG